MALSVLSLLLEQPFSCWILRWPGTQFSLSARYCLLIAPAPHLSECCCCISVLPSSLLVSPLSVVISTQTIFRYSGGLFFTEVTCQICVSCVKLAVCLRLCLCICVLFVCLCLCMCVYVLATALLNFVYFQ